MAHRPPVTWNDVATKHDIASLDTTLRAEMQAGFADVRTELANAVTNQTKWLITVLVAWSALLVTAVRLLP